MLGRTLLLAALVCIAIVGLAADQPQGAESPPAGNQSSPTRAVTILRHDGTSVTGEIHCIIRGTLHAHNADGRFSLPLESIKSITFVAPDAAVSQTANHPAAPSSDTPIRIAVVDIELDTKLEAKKRLDRIGAVYELVPPDAPLETFKKFQIVYFSRNWAALGGLADLKEKFHRYVREGGSMLFCEPDVNGDAVRNPALKLLPYPIAVSSNGAMGGRSVRAYTDGSPHPLMQGVEQNDLPYPSDHLTEVDKGWTVLAKSDSSSFGPTLIVAEFGQGRVVLHTNYDDYGSEHYFRDRFVVRLIKWLARRPDADVQRNDDKLGTRRWPEWVERLNRDYAELLAAEPPAVQEQIRLCELALQGKAPAGSAPTTERDAPAILRRLRSKAAIPMLLRIMADEHGVNNRDEREMYRTIEILTGRKLVGEGAEGVARQWWFVERDKLTTDPARMTADERDHMTAKLMEIVAWGNHYLERSPDRREGGFTPYTLYHLIFYGGDRYYWTHDDFPDVLVPSLLAACDVPERRFTAMTVLAELRSAGRAKTLPALVKDSTASTSRRILAAIALWRADKTVAHDELITLVKTEKSQELQIAAIITLGQTQHAAAVETIVGYLRSPQPQLQEAAVWAAYSQKAPQSVAPMAEALRKVCRYQSGSHWMVRALGEIKTQESAEVLVELMEKTLQEAPADDILSYLLDAFEAVTEKRFDRGTTGTDAEKEIVGILAALKWWRTEWAK